METMTYQDPDADIVISGAHRGNIVCRKLEVTAEGSIVGDIEASVVHNRGRIHGIVNASATFLNFPNAKFRGSVFAPKLGISPESAVWEASTSMTHRFSHDMAAAALVTPTGINEAIREGINRELGRMGISATDHQGFPVPAVTQPSVVASAPGKVAETTEIEAEIVAAMEEAFVVSIDNATVDFAPAAPRRTLRSLPPLFAVAG
jgi:hypothetical protein